MKLNEMQKMLKTGRWKAIIKTVGQRRFFLGIERANKNSRKSSTKFMCPPIDLDQVTKQHQQKTDKSK